VSTTALEPGDTVEGLKWGGQFVGVVRLIEEPS